VSPSLKTDIFVNGLAIVCSYKLDRDMPAEVVDGDSGQPANHQLTGWSRQSNGILSTLRETDFCASGELPILWLSNIVP